MLRVAKQVRIFPLLKLGGERSPYLKPVTEYFSQNGCNVQVINVPYEFQKDGNEMLHIELSEYAQLRR